MKLAINILIILVLSAFIAYAEDRNIYKESGQRLAEEIAMDCLDKQKTGQIKTEEEFIKCSLETPLGVFKDLYSGFLNYYNQRVALAQNLDSGKINHNQYRLESGVLDEQFGKFMQDSMLKASGGAKEVKL